MVVVTQQKWPVSIRSSVYINVHDSPLEEKSSKMKKKNISGKSLRLEEHLILDYLFDFFF